MTLPAIPLSKVICSKAFGPNFAICTKPVHHEGECGKVAYVPPTRRALTLVASNNPNFGLTPKHPKYVAPKEASVEQNHTLLQGLLRSGVTVAEVIEKYHLNVNRSKRHSNLIQFKYDQIYSDMNDILVQQCRGIIMDEKDNWKIVARPFDKFFNYGEEQAAKIDWATAKAVKKEDGSCCILYWYDGWHVATLGSADASGNVHGFAGMTFKDLFWETFKAKKYKLPDPAWQDVTFIFELMTPHNRVVVQHATPDLKFLGARVASGDEWAVYVSNILGYETPKLFPMKNLADLIEMFKEMDPLQQEGFVVVDQKYNRIKVKHPGYVRIHHLKSAFTLRNVVEMIRQGDELEFLAYFPEHQPMIDVIHTAFYDLIDRILISMVKYMRIESRKEFALAIKDLPYAGVLFNIRNGKAETVLECLQKCHIDTLIRLLEVPGKEEVVA